MAKISINRKSLDPEYRYVWLGVKLTNHVFYCDFAQEPFNFHLPSAEMDVGRVLGRV